MGGIVGEGGKRRKVGDVWGRRIGTFWLEILRGDENLGAMEK